MSMMLGKIMGTKKRTHYHMTDNLKKILMDKSIREEVLDLIDSWEKEYQEMAKEHSPERASYELSLHLERTISKHQLAEKELIKAKGGIKCKKGCFYCCEQSVSVSIDEALCLYKIVEHNKITLDWAKIERQAKYNNDQWLNQPREDWACALLDKDKTCSMYAYRPYTCRKYLVFSDPSECSVENTTLKETILKLCSPDAEIAIGGAWNATGDVQTLPKQLLKAREIYENRAINNESE